MAVTSKQPNLVDDLQVLIQIKQWNCTILQIHEKVLTKSKKHSDKSSEVLKEARSKQSISLAKAKHKICAIVDEYDALNKKTPTESISDLSNHEITQLMKDKELL